MTNNRNIAIKDEVRNLQKSLENVVQKAENNINELKKATNAANFRERLSEVMKELQQIEDEKKRLQERIESEKLQIADNSTVMVLEILLSTLKQFGCSVNISWDSNKKNLYTFDFGNKNYITIQTDNANLSLVEMSPENANFDEIKAFLAASQDFIGLLSSFRDKVLSH